MLRDPGFDVLPQGPPKDYRADDGEVHADKRPDDARGQLRQNIGADGAAKRARNYEPSEKALIDSAKPPMGIGGGSRGEDLGGVNAALATEGATPKLSSTLVEMTPYAIPSAPSTICAANPTATKSKKSESI